MPHNSQFFIIMGIVGHNNALKTKYIGLLLVFYYIKYKNTTTLM